VLFFTICGAVLFLGVAFTLSGVGTKTAYKASDADLQWDEETVWSNNACSPINSISFLDHDD
jgi:hypothetical protein